MAQTATNPQTGEKVEWNGSAWIPVTKKASISKSETPNMAVGRTATNPQTGERVAWDGKAWVPLKSPGVGALLEAGVRQGAADIYSLPNAAGQLMSSVPETTTQGPYGMPMPPGIMKRAGEAVQSVTPSREELMLRAERNVGPMAQPTNEPGRELVAAVRGGTGGLLGGPAGVAGGVMAGAGQQFAAERGAPEWVQVLAGIGVPVAGLSSISGLRSILRSTPQRVLERAAANLTPLQAQAARDLMDQAERMGTPLTLPEAAAAVTGQANTRLLNLQRIVEQSPGGQPIMTPFMAQRIEGNRAAAWNVAGNVAPEIAGEARTMAPVRLQQAAEGAINDVRTARTAVSSPIYQSVTGVRDNLTPQAFQPIAADPAIAAAIHAVRNDPAYQRILNGLPDENMLVLDAAYKHLSDGIDTAMRAGERNRANFLGGARTMLVNAMEDEFPDYAVARARHEAMSRRIEPTERGPVGKIADNQTADVGTQANILTPMNPDTLDPAMIQQSVRQLGHQDPTALQNWLRINLEANFEKAMKRRGDPSGQQWGGAQFAVNMAGNGHQAENIRAMIEATSGAQAVQGWDNLMRVLEAQGTRMKPGSLTAMNQLDIEDLKAGRIPIGLVRPKAELDNWWTRRKYTNNSEALARWITGEDARTILNSLSRVDRGSAAERFAFGAFAASFMQQANQLESENAPKGQE